MYSVDLISLTLRRESPLKESFSSWPAEMTGSGMDIHTPDYYQGPDNYILDRTIGEYTWACTPFAVSLINIGPQAL